MAECNHELQPIDKSLLTMKYQGGVILSASFVQRSEAELTAEYLKLPNHRVGQVRLPLQNDLLLTWLHDLKEQHSKTKIPSSNEINPL